MDTLIHTKSFCRQIREQLINSPGVKEKLEELHEYDTIMYAHSENMCMRVLKMACIAKRSEEDMKEIGLAALLANIGYLNVPRELVAKEGSLTSSEFKDVKEHVKYSYEIAKEIGVSENVLRMISNHHRTKDGNGYPPDSEYPVLKDDMYIIAAETFEALQETRSYRNAYPLMTACEILEYSTCNDVDLDIYLLLKESLRM